MKNYFGLHTRPLFRSTKVNYFIGQLFMTAVDSIKCRCVRFSMTGQVALRSFTCTIFRAVFDSRSSFFAPKPQGNACYARSH